MADKDDEIEIDLSAENADEQGAVSEDDKQAAAAEADKDGAAKDERAGGDEAQQEAGADGQAEGEEDRVSPGVQKRLDKLTWEKHEFERAARAAMETAEAAQARLEQMEARVGNLETVGAHNTAQGLEQEIIRLRGNLREAIDGEDVDRQLELTEQLGERKTQLKQIQAQAQQRQQQGQQPGQGERRSAPARPAARPDLAKQWAAKNADWFEKPGHEVETAAVLYIDRQLTSEGLDANSPIYYEELDRRLAAQPGFAQRTGQVSAQSANGGQPGNGKPPASPVAGRSSAGEGARQRPGTVKLSAVQIQIAKDLGMYGNPKAMQAYARELREKKQA